MKMNILAIECIIIGTCSLILGLGGFACEILLYNPFFNESQSITRIVLCLTSFVLSILLIIGIVKRRYLLMVPWLLLSFAFSTFFLFYTFVVVVLSLMHPYAMLLVVLIFCCEIIVLYPMCALCHEIRVQRNREARNNENYTQF